MYTARLATDAQTTDPSTSAGTGAGPDLSVKLAPPLDDALGLPLTYTCNREYHEMSTDSLPKCAHLGIHCLQRPAGSNAGTETALSPDR
jgi:hypothetical protein